KEAVASPLAQKIFGFPWVSRVFIGPEFVTITKQDWVDWDIIAEPLSDLLKEHLDLGEPVISDTASLRTEYSEDDTPEIRLIKETLDRYIRPVVAMDGGDITFSDFKDDVVYLKMTGACNGCPSSTQTLKEGVEVKLKEVLPSIKEIVAVPNAN
ncbi:MAG: NifU family protein, partial [Bdellovibrionales bacterium]|nr:NifU family protein [Bdellovibrionales bacterium]